MKKTITSFGLLISLFASSQTNIANFESFTLSPSSAYTNTNSISFQTTNASFEHVWDSSFDYWSGGFSYTNIKDSSTAGFANLYGVRSLQGYNNSDKYAVGKNWGTIKLISPFNKLDGFYITNTTYAYKSMLLGDLFAKKFGGTSGNDPDFFKVTIKGFFNGAMKTDSVEYYLADFRFSNNTLDYILDNWQWVNTSSLGVVDSVRFYLYSSDNGSFGMNTPAFFALDDFTTSQQVGLAKNQSVFNVSIYPNPASDKIFIQAERAEVIKYEISSIGGQVVLDGTFHDGENIINLEELNSGIYFIKIGTANNTQIKKIIKD